MKSFILVVCIYIFVFYFFFVFVFFSPLVTKRKVGGMDNPSEAGTGWGKERKREKTRKKKQTNKKKIAGSAFPTWPQTVARHREKQTERKKIISSATVECYKTLCIYLFRKLRCFKFPFQFGSVKKKQNKTRQKTN